MESSSLTIGSFLYTGLGYSTIIDSGSSSMNDYFIDLYFWT